MFNYQNYIISHITWRTYLVSPFFYFVKQVLLFDVSLITLKDERPAINRFLKWMDRLGLKKRVTVVTSHEYEKQIWRSKEASVLTEHKHFRAFRNTKNELFYYTGYLIHIRQLETSVKDYISAVCELKKIAFHSKIASSFLESVHSVFGIVVALPLLVWRSRTYTTIKLKRSRSIERPALCVDCIHGPGLTEAGHYIDFDFYDTCFAGIHDKFTDDQLVYWAYASQKAQLKQWNNALIKQKGSKIFGDQLQKIQVGLKDYVSIIFEAYKIYLKIVWTSFRSKNILLRNNRQLLRYCCDRLRVRFNFLYTRPKIYLSRLDYSYRHHAIGAVCHQLGIHFSGVCHSPLGGSGHTPNSATISFDQFFIHHGALLEHFFPTWSNPNIDISAVGAWRTDFVYQSSNTKNFSVYREKVKAKLGQNYIVALHLPVPNTCLYDEKLVRYWMQAFLDMLREVDSLAFVLLPRRLQNSPRYFYECIEALKATGKAILAEEVSTDWKNAYGWTAICDALVGCTYSDAVAEALTYGKPALTYADIGKGQSALFRLFPELVHFNKETLLQALRELTQNQFDLSVMEKARHTLVKNQESGHRKAILTQLEKYC